MRGEKQSDSRYGDLLQTAKAIVSHCDYIVSGHSANKPKHVWSVARTGEGNSFDLWSDGLRELAQAYVDKMTAEEDVKG